MREIRSQWSDSFFSKPRLFFSSCRPFSFSIRAVTFLATIGFCSCNVAPRPFSCSDLPVYLSQLSFFVVGLTNSKFAAKMRSLFVFVAALLSTLLAPSSSFSLAGRSCRHEFKPTQLVTRRLISHKASTEIDAGEDDVTAVVAPLADAAGADAGLGAGAGAGPGPFAGAATADYASGTSNEAATTDRKRRTSWLSPSGVENELPREILSGMVVALATIPTSTAYAQIVGVNPIVGIWTSAIVGLFVTIVGELMERRLEGPCNC
jgi:hypothetical protein